jgi:hypothetical protein
LATGKWLTNHGVDADLAGLKGVYGSRWTARREVWLASAVEMAGTEEGK